MVAGVCRWCAKMELRRPQFNFLPKHVFSPEIPVGQRINAAEAMNRALNRPPA